MADEHIPTVQANIQHGKARNADNQQGVTPQRQFPNLQDILGSGDDIARRIFGLFVLANIEPIRNFVSTFDLQKFQF